MTVPEPTDDLANRLRALADAVGRAPQGEPERCHALRLAALLWADTLEGEAGEPAPRNLWSGDPVARAGVWRLPLGRGPSAAVVVAFQAAREALSLLAPPGSWFVTAHGAILPARLHELEPPTRDADRELLAALRRGLGPDALAPGLELGEWAEGELWRVAPARWADAVRGLAARIRGFASPNPGQAAEEPAGMPERVDQKPPGMLERARDWALKQSGAFEPEALRAAYHGGRPPPDPEDKDAGRIVADLRRRFGLELESMRDVRRGGEEPPLNKGWRVARKPAK